MASKPLKKPTIAKSDSVKKSLSKPLLLLLSVIGLSGLTYFIYSPCLTAGFTNWDDKRYIFESPMIRQLSWENIKIMFSEKVLMSYNPLVILSFALEYTAYGPKAEVFHLTNVLFHVANTVLLLLVFNHLTGNLVTSLLIAGLFGLHPMHVESVAWIASRKDVLYTFFYFLSWLLFVLHLKRKNLIFYIASIMVFALSLLSKAQAVTLPLVLIMTSWLYNKEITKRDFILSIPFFILSILVGIYTLSGSASSADKYAVPLTIIEKILYSIMAAGIYLYKSIIPFGQTAIYAFPKSGSPDFFPQLLVGIVLILSTLFAAWYYRKKVPVVTWGIVFFYVHIFLVLHLVATNSSLIYERFTYVAYVGCFFIIAQAISSIKKNRRSATILLSFLMLTAYAYSANQRCKIWNNSETLWSDIIEKNPDSDVAYNNRGEYYYQQGDLQNALSDFNNGILLSPNQPSPYNNRSIIYYKNKQYDLALKDIDKALAIEPEYAAAYNNKGNIYFNIPNYDSAVVAFAKAVELLENYPTAWCNLGSSYLQKGDLQKALSSYQKSMAFDPSYDEPVRYTGLVYIRMDSLEQAYPYFAKAQQLNPSSNALNALSDEYLKRGSQAFTNKEVDKALQLFTKASEVNPGYAEPYYNIGGVWLAKGNAEKAREYWIRTLQLDPNHKEAQSWLSRIGQ